ncbi:hypothetical protein Trydic_g13658 [Trypoxylus dichotomus]
MWTTPSSLGLAIEIDNFFGNLNSQHPDIKSSMEVEKNGVVPYFHALVIRKILYRLRYSVYRKIAHTDRYLHADSHHHPVQKLSVVNFLVHGAASISEPDSLSKELHHVKSSLQNNGYQHKNIQKVINKHLHPSHADKPQDSKIANIVLSPKDQV